MIRFSVKVVPLAYLDSLDSVLNLIDTALRGEGVHTTIVVLFAIRKPSLDSEIKGKRSIYVFCS